MLTLERLRRRLAIAIVLFLVALHVPAAAATGAPVCGGDAAGLLQAVRTSTVPRGVIFSRFSRVPISGPMDFVVTGDGYDPEKVASYEVVFHFGEGEPAEGQALPEVDGLQVSAVSVPEGYIPQNTRLPGVKARLLRFTAPGDPGEWWWTTGSVTVVACGPDGHAAFVARTSAVFSDRATCIAATIALTLAVYILSCRAVYLFERKLKASGKPLNFFRYLDPVVLSSGANGAGSVSRLQILFFSLLIFSLLFYLLIRVGLLSDMSSTVLLLLGISAVGAAASKATDTSRNRLDFENWAWLVNHHWLPKHGTISVTVPRWRDLVTADDGFDVYHFQMVIFSLVVGAALLQVGFLDLATFQIPESLLGVLGLSQAVYVGGKLVSSPSCANLNEAVTELRKLDAAAKAASESVRPGTSSTASKGEAELADPSAKADSSRASPAVVMTPEDAFLAKLDLVRTMFESVFSDIPDNAEPKPRAH